jgi:hypothetical protein
MPDLRELAGTYSGRFRVRPGMERDLAPAERKKLLKQTDPVSLDLRADGTFTFKGSAEGRVAMTGTTLVCQPASVCGTTREQMERAAEEAGRVFGLAWLFQPFELTIEGDLLVSREASSVVYTEFTRDG